MNLNTPLNFHIPVILQVFIGLVLSFLVICIPLMLKYKHHFFGWENFKWLVRELVKMYSHEPSFFSYKRFQMGVAFFIFTQGAMFTLTNYVKSVENFLLWAVPVLLIAGYTLEKVQKEKIDLPKDNANESQN